VGVGVDQRFRREERRRKKDEREVDWATAGRLKRLDQT
jgi:hypothetical protein